MAPIEIGKLFSLDRATQIVKEIPSVNASAFDLASCSCSSALASADYTIHYFRRENGYYYIAKIVLDITIYDSVSLDSKFCQANNDEATFIPQTFSVKY